MASPLDNAQITWKHSQALGHFVYVRSRDIILLYRSTGIEWRPRPPAVTPESLAYAIWEPMTQGEAYHIVALTQQHDRSNATIPRTMPDTGPADNLIDRDEVIIGNQGERFRLLVQANNRVQNMIQTHPPKDITDPTFLRAGVKSQGKLMETPGDKELLFSSYKRRKSPREYFKVGKVFMVLWAEPVGAETATLISQRTYAPAPPPELLPPGMSVGRFGEYVYSSVRRFVVIREATSYCSALPITTYHNRGVSKETVKKAEHAIIYTGKYVPQPRPGELPRREIQEVGMQPDAIRVDTDSPEDKLDPMSRLNYGAVHTIQHNIKVKPYGKVHAKSYLKLLQQFASVWNQQHPAALTAQAGPSTTSGPRQSTLDPNIQAGAIKRLMSAGMSEEYAWAELTKRMNKLMAQEGHPSQGKGKQPATAARSARSPPAAPTQSNLSSAPIARQKAVAVEALMKKGLTRLEAQRKVDEAFTQSGRRQDPAVRTRTLKQATQERQESEGGESENEVSSGNEGEDANVRGDGEDEGNGGEDESDGENGNGGREKSASEDEGDSDSNEGEG